jgi:hypothetical protein
MMKAKCSNQNATRDRIPDSSPNQMNSCRMKVTFFDGVFIISKAATRLIKHRRSWPFPSGSSKKMQGSWSNEALH